MFTRYSVPKNYSGSRFSVNEYETEMKTHTSSGVKTSISPSFNRENSNTSPQEIKNPPFFTVSDDNTADDIEEEFSSAEVCEENDNTELNDKRDADKRNNALKEFKSSAISLFESIQRDDLMLIALILLLSNEENPTLPLLLSLLLLYR